MVRWGGDVRAERPREEVRSKGKREEDELDKGKERDDRRGRMEVGFYLDTRAID